MMRGVRGRRLFWALLAGLMVWQVARTPLVSDVSAFLPSKAQGTQELLLETLRAGTAARLWLIVLEGAGRDELALVAVDLGRRLRDSGRFAQVLDGSDRLDEGTRRLLTRYRYLLDPAGGAATFTTEGLHAALRDRLEALASPLGTFEKAWLPRDPVGALFRVIERVSVDSGGLGRYRGALMSPDGRQAFLLLESRAPGMDLDAQAGNLRVIETAFDRAAAGTDVRLRLSGAPWFALQTRERIRADSRRLSLVATLFMLGFMAWVWRDLRRVVLAGVPLALGILAGAAATGAIFGSLHGITLAFGITLLGVAIDYPVHLFAHQRPGESASLAVRRIWPTLRLGVLTTLVGYGAMAFTSFTGLAQLGVFSMAGLATAAAVVRWLLPDFLPPPTRSPRLLDAVRRMLDVRMPPAAGPLAGALLMSAAALSWWWTPEPWSRDIRDLSPVPEALRRADGELRRAMGAPEPGHLIVVRGADVQQVLEREERLRPLLEAARRDGVLEGHEMAADLLPSAATQRFRRTALPDEAELRRRFTHALRELPFRADAFEPFFADVRAARRLEPLLPEDLAGTPLGLRLNTLLTDVGGEVFGIVRVRGLHDPAALARRLHAVEELQVHLLDLTAETSRLMDAFRHEALQRAAFGAGLIVLILSIALRDYRRVLRIVGGVTIGLGAAVTVLLAAGETLNLFHLVSLLLIVGLGIDYGLFFTRREEDPEVAARTALALLVCGVSTAGVFAILALSEIPVLHAIGTTVALGGLFAFLGAWMLATRSRT